MDTIAEDPLVTGPKVSTIETDLFCAACGYNLRSLAVVRDERLGILLVRCTECGKFHPAGTASGAGNVWLSRLGIFLLMLWVLFLISLLVAAGFASGALYALKIEPFLQYEWRATIHWRPYVPANAEEAWQLWLGDAVINCLGLAWGALVSTLMTTFLWHLRRRWCACLGLLSLAALGFVATAYYLDRARYAPWMLSWFVSRLGAMLLLQLLGIAAGARYGRGIVRCVLRVALTRRLLQLLRFLWEVDNLRPPFAPPPPAPAVTGEVTGAPGA